MCAMAQAKVMKYKVFMMKNENKKNAFQEALRISEDAAKLGFDFPDHVGPIEKIREEVRELEQVLADDINNTSRITDELGDIIFATLNLARKLGQDPGIALAHTNKKFSARFSYVKDRLATKPAADLAEMEVWWEEAKRFDGL